MPSQWKRWTQEDERALLKSYGKVSLKNIATQLGRTIASCESKLQRLGIPSPYKVNGDLTILELAQALNVNRDTIRYWHKHKGLKIIFKVLNSQRKIGQIKISDFWKWAEKNKEWLNLGKLEKNILGVEPKWVDKKRRDDINGVYKKYRPYTKYEDDFIISNYWRMPAKDIAAELNRSVNTIQARIRKLGLQKIVNIKWKPVEVQMLIEMKKNNKSDDFIAEELGRSRDGVQKKRQDLMAKGLMTWEYNRNQKG